MKRLSIFALIVGLIASPALTFADNSASAYTDDGSAVIGALSAMAGLADSDGYTKVLSSTLSNSGAPTSGLLGAAADSRKRFSSSLDCESTARTM